MLKFALDSYKDSNLIYTTHLNDALRFPAHLMQVSSGTLAWKVNSIPTFSTIVR